MADLQWTMTDFRFVARAPDGKELQSSVVPFPVPPPARGLGKLQWLHQGSEFAHGEKVKLKVPAEGLDGKSVRFLVEHQESKDQWAPYAAIECKVQGGEAVGELLVAHPRLKTGKLGKGEAKGLKPAKLRARAQLV
jgi:hypothetical protein